MSTLAPVFALQQQMLDKANDKFIDTTQLDRDYQVKQDIINRVFPPSQRTGIAGFNNSALQVMIDALNNGFIRQYYSPDEVGADCAKANKNPNSGLAIATRAASSVSLTGGKLALGGLKLGINVAPVVGQVISAAIGVFTAISAAFQHHKLAVAEEQTILCAAVPTFNNAIDQLDQLVATGTISNQEAYQALNYIQANYIQQVQPILKQDPTHCNASCVIDRAVIALSLYKAYKYQEAEDLSITKSASNTISDTLASVGVKVAPKTIGYGILLVLGVILLVVLIRK